jgi:hypothetical protein
MIIRLGLKFARGSLDKAEIFMYVATEQLIPSAFNWIAFLFRLEFDIMEPEDQVPYVAVAVHSLPQTAILQSQSNASNKHGLEFPFFGLPLEIRVMIYRYVLGLFSFGHLEQRKGQLSTFAVFPGPYISEHLSCPMFSRESYNEAIKIFYGETLFCAINALHMLGFVQNITPSSLSKIRKLRLGLYRESDIENLVKVIESMGAFRHLKDLIIRFNRRLDNICDLPMPALRRIKYQLIESINTLEYVDTLTLEYYVVYRFYNVDTIASFVQKAFTQSRLSHWNHNS